MIALLARPALAPDDGPRGALRLLRRAMTQQGPEQARPLADRSLAGDEQARRQLLAELYELLHDHARRLMRAQPPDHTLQVTALVNEACLRLLGGTGARWAGRDHVLGLAARAMRSVLIDHARRARRRKRSPDGERVPLDDLLESYEAGGLDLLALDEALERLASFDPQMARAVDLRFFAGLPVEEVARMLGLTRRTFERQWTATRAWLKAELR